MLSSGNLVVTSIRPQMPPFPLFRVLVLAPLLALLAVAARADDYPFELKLSHSGFGEKVLRGTLKGDSFDEFITSGNMHVRLSGSISGDRVRLSGDLKVPGNWGFKPFSTEGSFTNSGTFVGPIVIYPIIGRTARGSITITRPAPDVAETPPKTAPAPPPEPVEQPAEQAAEQPTPLAPSPAVPAPQPEQTVVLPPEPEEPPLSRNQRMAVQEQLAVLGLYGSGIDGDFGPGTRKAIKKYQRAHGFEPTGYVTEPMLAKLAKQAELRAAEIAAEQQLAEANAAEQRAAEEKAAQEKAAQEAAAAQEKAAQEKAAQEAAAAAALPPEPAAPAPPAQEAAPEQPATTPSPPAADPFGAVIAGLEPIDESYLAVKPAKIRRDPSVAAELIETLDVGARIDVLGRIPHEDWYLVAREGKPLGYVVVGQLAADDTRTTPADSAAAPPAPAPAPEQTASAPAIPPELASLDFGRYYALVIGNNAYKTLPKLNTAVTDAKSVAALLEKDYGFTVSLLTDATEEALIGGLAELRRKLTPQDNLLVYYAGHGWYDEEAQRGYWLPVDAAADNPSKWVSNADITDSLKTIKAKHVLVVADSCYSGSLTRGLAIATKGSAYFESIVEKRARTVLTSGGLEPVLDAGGGAHSVFAKAFLEALDANTGVVDGEGIYQRVREQVVLNAEQTPEYGNIRLAGHDGGDFLFVRK